MQRKSDERILNQYKEFCNREYKDAVRCIENKWFNPRDVINNAIQRCLGVAQFIQYLGVTYEEADVIFEEFKYKINNLRIDN